MKFQIVYHEIKHKEFRSKKSLKKFLSSKLDSEILRVMQTENKCNYMIEIKPFLEEYKYRDNE